MQLAQAEALGTLYDHNRRIRHIHPYFYHRGGHEYVRASLAEGFHIEILFLIGLLAVDYGQFVVRERKVRSHLLVSHFEILVVHLLAFEDERIYHKYLASQSYLRFKESIESETFAIRGMYGIHRFAARRHFVYDRDVQVAVKGHRQGPRDRGCSHNQHVRRQFSRPFGPQFRTLLYAETVLLIDDGQPEAAKAHVVFDQGVGAHYYAYAAVFEARVYLASFRGTAAARQQRDFYTCIREIFRYIPEMLLRQHLGRRHNAGLAAVAHRYQRTENGDHSLSAAYVALQQTVHLVPAFHIVPYLAYNAFLRTCKRERQGLETTVEGVADLRHQYAPAAVAAYISLLQQRELQIE